MEDIESLGLDTESDASGESSSQESSESTETGEGAQTSAPQQQPDTTPFHEHPRFKELVEQKNQALTAQKSLQEKYEAMERQLKELSTPKVQTQAEKDELIEDIRKVDPRLAERLEKFGKSVSSVEQLQAKLEAYEQNQAKSQQQQVVQSAVAKINQLHETNKVSPELKSFINNEIDRQYMSGQLKELSQVESLYKAVHEQYSKFVDSIKRSERESYVKAKTPDSKVPASQPKGEPAKPAPKKPAYSKDPEVAKQQIVSRYLKMKAAEKDASPV